MKILSVILLDPNVSPHYRVMASKHLNELRTQHAPKDSLGPPAPMTDDERIERIASLMDCVGKDLTLKAMEKQWPSSSSGSSSPSSSSSESSGQTTTSRIDPSSSSTADASSPSSEPPSPAPSEPAPTDTPDSSASEDFNPS